jgi:hypothetical protein
MNKPNRWRLGHAAFWGLAFSVAIDLLEGNSGVLHPLQAASVDPAAAVGSLMGTLLAGAVLFVLIAAIRNRIVSGIWR